jgi:hypothetical protein
MEEADAASCNFTRCDPSPITCGVTPTEHCYSCPEGCDCMTADNATALGYNTNVKCSDCTCGTDSISHQPKYCYGEKLYKECTTCGTCLPDSYVSSSCNLTQCDPTICAPPIQGPQHCYTCPQGCDCLTSDNATNLIRCSTLSSCKCSTGQPDKYCYRPCPSGCPCLEDRGAVSENLTKCPEDLLCNCPPGIPNIKCHCFHECPDGCDCLTLDAATQLGYDIANPCNTRVCGTDNVTGQDKHCYRH